MRRIKEQKGITLIALMITIVVLLILAAVAISSITNEGTLSYAENAAKDYNQAVKNEQTILDYYESYLGGTLGKWTQEGHILKRINADGTVEQLQVGDKVNYNEGTRHTSTIDSSFAMEDLEWRILGANSKGQVELISTKPTTSTFTLSTEQDYLKAEEKLDTLCNDLYANGEGVTERSLKVEDIDKLAKITDAERKQITTSYGTLWRYKFDATLNKTVCSKTEDNDGKTWTDYAASSAIFKAPGEAEINSTNYLDSKGAPIIKEYVQTYYSYEISNEINSTTTDGISIASLITQGLNNAGTAASGTNVTQWLSSISTNTHNNGVNFRVRIISGDKVYHHSMLYSYQGTMKSGTYAVRPVVTLPANYNF